MKKALGVLYALREAVSLSKNYPSDEILDEAIAELEEAQLNRREWYQKGYNEAMKPKTCEGCFYDDKDGVLHVECAFCLRNSNDNFKPKDTQ